MKIDVVLPFTLFLITTVVSLLYGKYEGKIKSLLGGKELRLRDAVFLVVAMGVMVTSLMFITKEVILAFFMFIYSLVLFTFTYLVKPKWYLAILPPAFFIILYFYFWNLYWLNFFAFVFSVFVSVYLGSLFTWKITAAFAALLTLMDVVQVLVTGFMGTSAQKIVELGLPTVVILPTFPSEGHIILGLGDIFLSGLLVIQTTRKYGRKFGIVSTISIASGFLLFETILLNFIFRYFPATVMVIFGWLAALGIRYLYKSLVFKTD